VIHRRHVLYVEGYDPQGATGYYGLFKGAVRRFQRSWPLKPDVGPLEIDSEALAHWTVDLLGPNWKVATRYEFLRQEQIIGANIAQPMWRQLPRSLFWIGAGALTGWLPRVFRAGWRFGTHLLYFQLMLLLWIAVSIGAGWIVAAVARHFAGFSALVEFLVAVVVAVGVFAALRPLLDRWHVTQITNHWPILREFARGDATCFDRPIDDGAQRLIAAARANEADEIVVIGHSGGGVIAPAVVARALELDPDLGRHGPPVVLLTLGSIMPAVALYAQASRMHAIVRRLATEPSITWIDSQSRKDVMNFWNFDPVDGTGVKLDAPRHNPMIWQVRFKEMVSPEFYKRLRLSFFRLHYQFILGGDRRAPYDYVMLTCGPLPATAWAKNADAALASFAPDGTLNEAAA
jgi:hypothetical protein